MHYTASKTGTPKVHTPDSTNIRTAYAAQFNEQLVIKDTSRKSLIKGKEAVCRSLFLRGRV
jgi:hypothetical protein